VIRKRLIQLWRQIDSQLLQTFGNAIQSRTVNTPIRYTSVGANALRVSPGAY
jgi:hypothetical protein